METASREMSKYAVGLKYSDLPTEVVEGAKRRVLDTIGCALGGYLGEPSKIIRQVVGEVGGIPECTIIGSGSRTSCSNATLVNGLLTRYLAYIDTYIGRDFAHPSENIATALSVGERQHSSGRDVITAIVLGYEFHQRMVNVFDMTDKGWQSISVAGYVTPIVAGKLLGLTKEEMANAIGINGSHNHALGFYGEKGSQVSMMKYLGYHFAAQAGVTAALLAKRGFTGPDTIIETLNRVIGEGVDLFPLIPKANQKDFLLLKACIKPFTCGYIFQSSVTAVLEIVRKHHIRAEDVEQMNIKVFSKGTMASWLGRPLPEKREIADHTPAYLLAIALMEGAVGPDQFANEQWKDPTVRALMAKMNFSVDKEFDKVYPAKRPSLVEIITKKGDVFSCRVDYPRGSPENQMTDDEIEDKFRRMASRLMGEDQIRHIIDTCYYLDKVEDIGQLFKLLVV